MTKGNDSREFFELFKAPQNVQKEQDKEVKPVTESKDVNQEKSPIPEEKAVSKPTVSADPLEWIKNTHKEDTVFRKKLETPIAPHTISGVPKGELIPRKDEVVLRQETLIIGAIAATFLSIACFFVGHKVGYNKGLTSRVEEWAETIESEDVKSTNLGQSRFGDGAQKAANKAVSQKAEKQAEQPKLMEVPQKTASKAIQQKAEKQPEQSGAVIKDKWTIRLVTYKNTSDNIEKAKEVASLVKDTLGYDAFVVNAGKSLFVCVGEFETNDSADLISTQKVLAELQYENKKQFEGCYPVRMK
ncbi:MAG: hypothetical protein NG784_00610 [Candidatus Jettenia sp.]|nr:hypothetical protein [Candidatus Jettenia sp.]